MKKITKIISFIFLFSILFSRICFADVIMPGEDPRNHGMGRYDNWQENRYVNTYSNRYNNDVENSIDSDEKNLDTLKVLGVGVLIAIIISCTLVIVVQLVRNSKGKENNANK